MMLLSLVFSIAAFTLFGLAMNDHHLKHLGARPSPMRKRRLRIMAWVNVAVSLPCAVASHGWIFGPILWTGVLMFGAAIVFLSLNLLPARRVASPPQTKTTSGSSS